MTPIKTRIGFADFGEYDHFGKRLYRDFAGNASYLALAAFSLTGREISAEDAALLDDVTVAAHVPEPRVWPMKLARLVASSGRPITGYLASLAVLDGDVLGGSWVQVSARLFQEARESKAAGPLEAFVQSKNPWPGPGVVGRPVDERVVALTACVERRGAAQREHWTLFQELTRVVQAQKNIGATIFDAMAAVLLDVGFSPSEILPMATLLLQPQFLAQAFDGAMHPAADLQKLPDDAILYVGPPPRSRA